MKKLLILCLVMAMASAAWAGTVTMRVESGDQKTSYKESDTITIEVVADFDVANFSITKVWGDPTASSPALHTSFTMTPLNPGVVVNSGGVLIQSVAGSAASNISAGQVLWQFEYHVPDVPHSTWLTISSTDVWIDEYYGSDYADSINDLEIHVTPEPMTIALLGLGGLFLRRRK